MHVWDFKNGALSQWFYLEEDGDGDPETFFLKNRNSDLYIVPRHYFKDPKRTAGREKHRGRRRAAIWSRANSPSAGGFRC